MVSSTNKTDCHDITEILLKVALNIITITPLLPMIVKYCYIVPLKRGHLFHMATFSLQERWPYKRGITVLKQPSIGRVNHVLTASLVKSI
jgi:hypothetical protein